MYPGDFAIPYVLFLHANIRLLKLFLELPSLCLLLHVLPFIVYLFTAAESHVELYEATFKVEAEGHKSIALFLDFSEQAVNFPSVQKEFSISKRIFIENISPLIGVDVHTYDKTFSVSNLTKGLLNGSLSEAERFDFRSEKLNAAFQTFLHEKIMESLFVVCDLLNAVSHLFVPFCPLQGDFILLKLSLREVYLDGICLFRGKFISTKVAYSGESSSRLKLFIQRKAYLYYSSGNSEAGTKSMVLLKVSTAYTRTDMLSPIRKVFPLRSPLVISSFSIKTK